MRPSQPRDWIRRNRVATILPLLATILLTVLLGRPEIVGGADRSAATIPTRPWVEADEAYWLQNMAWYHQFSMGLGKV